MVVSTDVEQSVQRSNHKYKQLVKREIKAALKPELGKYRVECSNRKADGTASNLSLISLTGTVPITYRSAQYNIPLSIHLSEKYPYTPPDVYIRPTLGMKLSASCASIDARTGKVQIMGTWSSPTNDLPSLLKSLSRDFSASPPVFAESSSIQTQQQQHKLTTPSIPLSSVLPDSVIRTSLLSAAMDAGRRRLSNIYTEQASEISILARTEVDLTMSAEKINAYLAEIGDECEHLNEYCEKLRKSLPQLQSFVTRSRKNSNTLDDRNSYESAKKINNILLPTTPIFKQLLDAHAEDCALQDALYFLGEAQRKKIISLDVFLRQTRELARRQFFLRAVILKARKIANI